MWWFGHVRMNIFVELWKSLKRKTLILLNYYYYYYYSMEWLRFVIWSKLILSCPQSINGIVTPTGEMLCMLKQNTIVCIHRIVIYMQRVEKNDLHWRCIDPPAPLSSSRENTQMLVHSRLAQPVVHNECAGMCLKMSWTLFVVYIVCVCVKKIQKKIGKKMWWCCHVRINICVKLWKVWNKRH